MAHVVQEKRTYQRILLSDKSYDKLEEQGFEVVFSSNVSAVAVRGNDLIIRFHNSSIYKYIDKANLYLRLIGAASKGKWVWRFLRVPQVPYEKIGSLPLPEDTDETDEEIVQPRIPTYEVRAIVPTDAEKLKGALPQIKITPIVKASDVSIGQPTQIITKQIDTLTSLTSAVTTKTIPFFRSNKKWFKFDKKKDLYTLTDEAPKKAIESYKEYIEAKNKVA